MAQETKQTQAPLLCPTGCGFYGNPRTNGMCSICYKDSLQRQNASGRVTESVSPSPSGLEKSPSSPSSTITPSSSPQHNSTQSLVTSADVSQTEQEPGTSAQQEQTDSAGTSCSAAVASVQSASTGKRKLDEILQLDGESVSGSDAPLQPPSTESDESKPRKNRCFTCRKKVGLTGFDCRCGNLFCGAHRYSDVHSCSFDYKADAAERIRKENPVVMGEKVPKI
ncbi:AN1-type zinc finger protein 6 [Trichomycterus rosablanca]|uniref:AN1-type zinc finger protein 6 n=1 Tax=Trichomycterus rosablanca TaxID=2290929 RepID=UPI002F35B840